MSTPLEQPAPAGSGWDPVGSGFGIRAAAPVRYRQALGRSLAYYIDAIFFGAVALGTMRPPLQQRLGDKWNGTLVVNRSIAPPGGVGNRFGSALLLGLLADAVCFTVSICISLNWR